MTRIALAGVSVAALFAASAPVLAADLPQPAEPPVYQEPIPAARYDWTGFYFGGQLGWQWSAFDNNEAGGGPFDTDANGVAGGVLGGYNYQFYNNFVLGVEADFSLSDIEETSTSPLGASFRTKSDWNSNVRARAGWAFDRFMVYGAGGLAIADFEASIPGASDDTTKVGWTVGGGVEGLVTENITARVEYLYQDFGDESFTLGGTSYNTDLSNNIVRFGMSYKF